MHIYWHICVCLNFYIWHLHAPDWCWTLSCKTANYKFCAKLEKLFARWHLRRSKVFPIFFSSYFFFCFCFCFPFALIIFIHAAGAQGLSAWLQLQLLVEKLFLYSIPLIWDSVTSFAPTTDKLRVSAPSYHMLTSAWWTTPHSATCVKCDAVDDGNGNCLPFVLSVVHSFRMYSTLLKSTEVYSTLL